MELLRTERLALRDWTEDDVDAFLDVYGRDAVMRWLGPQPRRPVGDRDEALARLRRWRAASAGLLPPFGRWAVVPLLPDPKGPQDPPGPQDPQDPPGPKGPQDPPGPQDPNAPVGSALLLPLDDADGPTGLVEIGWHLHPDHQGRGYATEAAEALLAAARDAGIAAVLALTDLDNAPSQAVARRLGMRDEGSTDRWFGLTTRQFRRDLDAG